MHSRARPIDVRRSSALAGVRRAGRLIRGIAALAIAGLVCAPGASAAGPSASPTPSSPIEHIVVLMQENHTFDNYFGTYPGANGPPATTCMPRDPANPATGCVAPYHLPSRRTVDLSHGTEVAAAALNDGKLDGFIAAQNRRNLPGDTAMGYYDGSDLPFYWNLASTSVLADRFFSSDVGGSKENHMFWVSGQAGDKSVPAKGYEFDTIFDRLQAAGIDWKFYVQNYDPSITFRNLTGDPQDSQTIWVPLLNFGRFIDDPTLSSRIVDVSQYHEDLANGTLPAVAFIAPSGASEHPPGDVAIGQVYGASQIMALMESSSWARSLFVLTWDDWGGWYDHVLPPSIDANGYGMRVPALFVSPFAPAGRIDSTTYDFTSILRFIEDNWRLQPMTARDAAANSVATALDFASAPRAPILPGPVYPDDAQPNPRARVALLGIYGVVILAIPAGAWLWWRRWPWHVPTATQVATGAGAAAGASGGATIIATQAVAPRSNLRPVGTGQASGAPGLADHVLPRLTLAGMVTPVGVHDRGPRPVAAIPVTPIPLSAPVRNAPAAPTRVTRTGKAAVVPAVKTAAAKGAKAGPRISPTVAPIEKPARGASARSRPKKATTTAPIPAAAPARGTKAGRPTRAAATPVLAPAPVAGAPKPSPIVAAVSVKEPKARTNKATTTEAPIVSPALGRGKAGRAKPIATPSQPAPATKARAKQDVPVREAPTARPGSVNAIKPKGSTTTESPARSSVPRAKATTAGPPASRPATTTAPVEIKKMKRTVPDAAAPAGSAPAPAPAEPRAAKAGRNAALAPKTGTRRAPRIREDHG